MFPVRPAVAAEEPRLRDRREQIDGGSNEPTFRILQRLRHTFGPVLSRTLPRLFSRTLLRGSSARRLWGGRRDLCVWRRGRALRPRSLAQDGLWGFLMRWLSRMLGTEESTTGGGEEWRGLHCRALSHRPMTSARSSASRDFGSEPFRIGSNVTPICCVAAPLFTAHSGGKGTAFIHPFSLMNSRRVRARLWSYGCDSCPFACSAIVYRRPNEEEIWSGTYFQKCDFGTSPNEPECRGGQDG
jgi:hypothetical protein